MRHILFFNCRLSADCLNPGCFSDNHIKFFIILKKLNSFLIVIV